MGKSIRSKSKRANRTEFRQTIGKQFVEQNMTIVQSKLQQCTEKGSLNSFDRLSAMLDTSTDATGSSSPFPGGGVDAEDIPVDAMDTSNGLGVTKKSSNKVPIKAKAGSKKKHMIESVSGQHGAKIARKKVTKMKRRGTVKKGQVVLKKKRTSRKKNSCAF